MKKRILLLTSEFPPLPGGIGNHAFLLASYLQKNNYTVSVLADHRSETFDLEFDGRQDFDIYRTKRNWVTYLNRIKKAFALVKKNEVVMASGKFSLWMGGLLSCFFSSKTYIAVLHGSELKAGRFFSQGLTRWSLKQFDRLIAVSNFTKTYALQLNPRLKIDVINNGIEAKPAYVCSKVKTDRLQLVTVGNLTFRKGQQNVINALPLLKAMYPNIVYHCVGLPTEKKRLETLANELNVTDKVLFHGALSDAERNEILKNSTVFVMLSDVIKNDFEGFGIAILEANSFGIPAVGSENSGIADAIKSGYSGILVNPHQPEELKKAIFEIVENYDQYSGNAMAWAADFDWKLVIERYLKVMEP